jgi:hypothetical protein
MDLMVDLAERYDADKIWFNRITDWNTYSCFADLDVAHSDNKYYPQYLDVLENIKKRAITYKKTFIEMPTLVSKPLK